MKAEQIHSLLSEKGYRSLKEWRIDNNHSYRIACTLGKQRALAEEFKLDYNKLSGVHAFNFRSYEDIVSIVKAGDVKTTNDLRIKFNTLYRCLNYNGWLSRIKQDLNLVKEYRRNKE